VRDEEQDRSPLVRKLTAEEEREARHRELQEMMGGRRRAQQAEEEQAEEERVEEEQRRVVLIGDAEEARGEEARQVRGDNGTIREGVLGVHVLPIESDAEDDGWLQRPMELDDLASDREKSREHQGANGSINNSGLGNSMGDNMGSSMGDNMGNSIGSSIGMGSSMGSSMGSTIVIDITSVETDLDGLQLGSSNIEVGVAHTPRKSSDGKSLHPRKPRQQHGSPAGRQPQTTKVVASKSVAHFLETQYNPQQQIRMAENCTEKHSTTTECSVVPTVLLPKQSTKAVVLPPTLQAPASPLPPTFPPPKVRRQLPRSKRLSKLLQKKGCDENANPNQGGKKNQPIRENKPSFLDELRNKAASKNQGGAALGAALGGAAPGGFLAELQLVAKSKQRPGGSGC
jgi:hypothetical protein